MKYIVTTAGQVGPKAWDNEISVTASNIREALDKAIEGSKHEEIQDGKEVYGITISDIVAVEQDDDPDLPEDEMAEQEDV